MIQEESKLATQKCPQHEKYDYTKNQQGRSIAAMSNHPNTTI